MKQGRPKRLPSSAGSSLLAALANFAPHALVTGSRGGKTDPFKSRRHDHGPGMKTTRRIKLMCGGR